MIKHLEIKTYEYCGISVTVKIDYNDDTISLVERKLDNYVKKEWIFINRGLEFMGSWIEILDAMKYAIEEAQKELEQYKRDKMKEKEDDFAKAHVAQVPRLLSAFLRRSVLYLPSPAARFSQTPFILSLRRRRNVSGSPFPQTELLICFFILTA
jgi:hypothetical protein